MIALDEDLARGRGVEEDHPARQDRPVPALAGQELAADDGQGRADRDLERGPRRGPLEPGAGVRVVLVLLGAGDREVLGVEFLAGARRRRGVVGLVLRSVEGDPQTHDRARRLADPAEDVLHGCGAARQVVLVAVGEQPVAYVRERRPAAARHGAGDEHVQGVEVAAQGRGRVAVGVQALRRFRYRCVRQVQGEGVGPFGAAGVEQQDAEPFGRDLGVGDPALHEGGRGRVPGALLQAALDHQRRLVQACGAPPQVVEDLLQLVGFGVEQFGLGVHQLREPRPERVTQPAEDPLRCLGHDGEAHHRAAREGDGQRRVEQRQRRHRRAHEQGDEVDLKADQTQRGAAVAEPAAVDGPEDQDDEEEVTRDDHVVQQRGERHRRERHGQAEGEGDRLAAYVLLPDREGGHHRGHGSGDHVGHIGVERREDGQGERDRADRPQSRHQPQQPRIGCHEPVPRATDSRQPCQRPHSAALS